MASIHLAVSNPTMKWHRKETINMKTKDFEYGTSSLGDFHEENRYNQIIELKNIVGKQAGIHGSPRSVKFIWLRGSAWESILQEGLCDKQMCLLGRALIVNNEYSALSLHLEFVGVVIIIIKVYM
jgi:hypothetical protein